MLEKTLLNTFIISWAGWWYTEWKILMKKVPLKLWEKVEIDKEDYEWLDKWKQRYLINLLKENWIEYKIIKR